MLYKGDNQIGCSLLLLIIKTQHMKKSKLYGSRLIEDNE